MADPSVAWGLTVSPRDQDEEYEGEGELPPSASEYTPTDTKYWKVQPVTGHVKPKWRNCHSAVLQNDSRLIVRSTSLFSSPPRSHDQRTDLLDSRCSEECIARAS